MLEKFSILKNAYNHVVIGDEKLRKLCYINEEEFKYLVILNDYLYYMSNIMVWQML